MPTVTCPTCGERGKIGPNLVGARIKCRKCGVSFMVSPPAAKAPAATSAAEPVAVVERRDGIEVEGLDDSAWALSTETGVGLTAVATPDSGNRSETSGAFVAAEPGGGGAREYKLLTPKDKFFEGKFEFGRLEDAINYYSRQGWVVKAMSTPHVKGFTGAMEEFIVVLFER
jgi:hypothetical protein